MERSLSAALHDEAVDSEYLEHMASRKTYTDIAKIIGRSRQRTTYLLNRALIRQMLLREHRAGRTPAELVVMMERLKI